MHPLTQGLGGSTPLASAKFMNLKEIFEQYGEVLTPEEIDDLLPVELGEDELVALPYEAPPELVPRSPFRVPTEEDKVRVHRIDLGGSSISGGPGRWGITDCGLGPKGLEFITRNYGSDNKPGYWIGETDKPVDCPSCVEKEEKRLARLQIYREQERQIEASELVVPTIDPVAKRQMILEWMNTKPEEFSYRFDSLGHPRGTERLLLHRLDEFGWHGLHFVGNPERIQNSIDGIHKRQRFLNMGPSYEVTYEDLLECKNLHEN